MKPYARLNWKRTLWPYLCLTLLVAGCHPLPEQDKELEGAVDYDTLDCRHLLGEDVKTSDQIAALGEEDRLADEAPLPTKGSNNFGQVTFSPVKTFGIAGSSEQTSATDTAPQRSAQRDHLHAQLRHIQAVEHTRGCRVQGQ